MKEVWRWSCELVADTSRQLSAWYFFLIHKILEDCCGKTDFQKLIEHTIKNDARHPCFHLCLYQTPDDHITPQNHIIPTVRFGYPLVMKSTHFDLERNPDTDNKHSEPTGNGRQAISNAHTFHISMECKERLNIDLRILSENNKNMITWNTTRLPCTITESLIIIESEDVFVENFNWLNFVHYVNGTSCKLHSLNLHKWKYSLLFWIDYSGDMKHNYASRPWCMDRRYRRSQWQPIFVGHFCNFHQKEGYI